MRPAADPGYAPALSAWGSFVAPDGPPRVPATDRRYQELDGHRGIAVAIVVVFHLYQFCNVDGALYSGTPAYPIVNSLDAAVPWLFVLTAFLLFEPIARSLIDGRQPFSARGFLVRRAVRILPLYVVAVGAVWFVRQRSLPGDWRDLLEHLTFTQVFDEKRIFYTIGPAWAVAVAVQFYLLLVVVALVLTRLCRRLPSRSGRVTAVAATTAALAVISLLWKAWAFNVGHDPTGRSSTTWLGPMANLDNFAVGMSVAVLVAALRGVEPLTPPRRTALRVLGLAILVAAFATRRADTWTAVYFATMCSVGFGTLIVAAVLGPCGDRVGRAVGSRPLRWLGAIAFSVYLWHEPLMLLLQSPRGLVQQAQGAFLQDVAVILLTSILVGWLSYIVIERPTRQLGRMFGPDGRLMLSPAGRAPDRIDWESFRSSTSHRGM